MMTLNFSIGNGPTKIYKNLSFFEKSEKCFEKFKMAAKRLQNIKQGDPALRVFERQPGWRFTARLRIPATFRKKRHFKLKVSRKSDYGLTYVIEIPLEYHIRLRTNRVRGREDKDFEIFYGTRTKQILKNLRFFPQI